MQVEGDERPAEGRRDAGRRDRDELERRSAPALERLVAPDPREPHEHVGEHRVAARRRVVVEVLLARDQLLAVDRRREEAAVLLVDEEVDGQAGEAM